MIELKIPAAGDAVAEVQLVEWKVKDGDRVKEGEVLYSIESEKSMIDVESPASGTVRIVAAAGEVFPVGHLVGRVE